MPLGTGQVTTTTSAKFIPDLWSDDIAARFKKNTVMGNLVTNWDHTGKPGAVVHVPSPLRSSATNIFGAQGQALTFTAPTEGEFTITINQHWATPKQIPDIVEKQNLSSYRSFITKDMAYSLTLAVDSYLWATARLLRGATADAGAVIGGDGKTTWNPATAGNGTALSDAGIRQMIQTLDDIDVPGTERFLVIPPVEKNRLLGNARFTEQSFVGDAGMGNSIRTGIVGNVYGIPVYVSTNSPSVAAANGTTFYRNVLLAHKDSIILATQIAPRVQSQYKVEFLSDVMVADVAFGAGIVRTEALPALDRGVVAFVPAI